MEEEAKARYEEKHAELVRIIQSFETLDKSKEWETIRELVYDRELDSIEKQILNASLESPLDIAKIHVLQGRRAQARKYDTESFMSSLKKQLADINLKIK